MMCDVMPTISEDGSNDRDSQYSGDDANFEQLMVNMLDERDKLMETLRENQENLAATQSKLQEIERERDALQKQLQSSTPQVRIKQGSAFFRLFRLTGFLELNWTILEISVNLMR